MQPTSSSAADLMVERARTVSAEFIAALSAMVHAGATGSFRYAAGAPGRAKALSRRRAAFKAARKSRKANRARGAQ